MVLFTGLGVGLWRGGWSAVQSSTPARVVEAPLRRLLLAPGGGLAVPPSDMQTSILSESPFRASSTCFCVTTLLNIVLTLASIFLAAAALSAPTVAVSCASFSVAVRGRSLGSAVDPSAFRSSRFSTVNWLIFAVRSSIVRSFLGLPLGAAMSGTRRCTCW